MNILDHHVFIALGLIFLLSCGDTNETVKDDGMDEMIASLNDVTNALGAVNARLEALNDDMDEVMISLNDVANELGAVNTRLEALNDSDALHVVEIVSISIHPYTPNIPANYDASGFCSGKVEIVFSSVPLNTHVTAGVTGYHAKDKEVNRWDQTHHEVWWEQDRETVMIYFDYRHRFAIDHCKVSGIIDWQSGRKHFEITMSNKGKKQR